MAEPLFFAARLVGLHFSTVVIRCLCISASDALILYLLESVAELKQEWDTTLSRYYEGLEYPLSC